MPCVITAEDVDVSHHTTGSQFVDSSSTACKGVKFHHLCRVEDESIDSARGSTPRLSKQTKRVRKAENYAAFLRGELEEHQKRPTRQGMDGCDRYAIETHKLRKTERRSFGEGIENDEADVFSSFVVDLGEVRATQSFEVTFAFNR
eukprot:GHVN01035308.1.p3 GENE.GHVN01035308.1~~GHVN01035308.1.p3  ORF type:complete len:146 (-),score=32.22 GHVN01035308.1:2447-2884(-)